MATRLKKLTNSPSANETSALSARSTLRRSAYNTLWCLGGCAVGDFGTILYFQIQSPHSDLFLVMSLAIINGIITSIILETIVLMRSGMSFVVSLKTAVGMSFISMVVMELAMNITDYILVGALILTWQSIIPALIAGFLAALPYNYYRLDKFNKSCCG